MDPAPRSTGSSLGWSSCPSFTGPRGLISRWHGTVTWAGWKTNGGGSVVVIRHPDGLVSTDDHDRSVTVAVGQVVKARPEDRRCGATGLTTGHYRDLRVQYGRAFDQSAVVVLISESGRVNPPA